MLGLSFDTVVSFDTIAVGLHEEPSLSSITALLESFDAEGVELSLDALLSREPSCILLLLKDNLVDGVRFDVDGV